MINKLNISISLLIIFHLVGLVGLIGLESPYILSLTPINLLLTVIVILVNHVDWQKGWILAVTAFLGFAIEVVGVNTGFPFGNYVYGPVLGWKVLNTPLMIGVNWLILLYGANAIARKFAMTAWAQALVAAGLMVMLDYLIEPVAIHFNFWAWTEGTPPLENYIGWFVTATILSLIWQYGRIKLNTRLAIVVFSIELSFFALLNLFLTYAPE